MKEEADASEYRIRAYVLIREDSHTGVTHSFFAKIGLRVKLIEKDSTEQLQAFDRLIDILVNRDRNVLESTDHA